MAGRPPDDPQGSRRVPRSGGGWALAALIFAVLLIANFAASSSALHTERVAIPYQPTFIHQLKHGNIKSITSQGDSIQGTSKLPVSAGGQTATRFQTQVPSFANQQALSALLSREHVTINARQINTGPSVIVRLLVGFGPVILLALLALYFFRRVRQGMSAAGGGGGISAFGRSRARRAEGKSTGATFDDVAGIDEAKADLTEIVDFLKDPRRFSALGGRIPRGVLLSGQPGTGKTLLARAVAGQAQVPFFQISASEFVEMIVGVGASRVRDMFAKAKRSAPAIIFIDELDAIGRKRGARSGLGGNEEREQTLNQILTEMDGFEPGTGVIVIAATNRPEILDPALLRPGRFDRRVAVMAPDKRGRREILEVHTKGMPLAEDVDLAALASQTPGMVGADLANLANEAALTAARTGHSTITRADFGASLDRILLGAERHTLLGEEDRRRIAYHEGGHAIVGMLTPAADPVRKVTIIPRGRSLGVTVAAPDIDQFNLQEAYLLAKIRVALGGRVAEELVFGNITTGAESDIQQLTQIARQMVGRWGMSEKIGPVAVLPSDGEGLLLPGASEVSPATQREVDREVRRLIEEARTEVRTLLREHRPQLDSLAAALLEEETLNETEAYAAAQLPAPVHLLPGRDEPEQGPEPETEPAPPVEPADPTPTPAEIALAAAHQRLDERRS